MDTCRRTETSEEGAGGKKVDGPPAVGQTQSVGDANSTFTSAAGRTGPPGTRRGRRAARRRGAARRGSCASSRTPGRRHRRRCRARTGSAACGRPWRGRPGTSRSRTARRPRATRRQWWWGVVVVDAAAVSHATVQAGEPQACAHHWPRARAPRMRSRWPPSSPPSSRYWTRVLYVSPVCRKVLSPALTVPATRNSTLAPGTSVVISTERPGAWLSAGMA